MSRTLVPLSMATVPLLPERCRSCVAWEVPSVGQVGADDGSFEKEVWLSGVMLTWGSAGQIALVDEQPAGYVLYAPPPAVPGVAAFASGPVSPDAVLLTTARIDEAHRGSGLGRFLLNGALVALARRGVRAVEMFGREDSARPDDAVPPCLLPAGFARAVGFEVVQPHPYYPRLRFEIRGESGWKAEVESALEQLFTSITISAATPVPVS